MKPHLPSRLYLGAALIFLCAAAPAFARGFRAPPPPPRQSRPAQRPAPAPVPRPIARPDQSGGSKASDLQGHLPKWMESHSNLSLSEQQRALQNEPGFRELPPETQQRYLDRLAQLYNMKPDERGRMLDRTEALERLTPAQRQQYRGAAEQLKALPPPRQRLVAKAILDLREMAPEQRERVIDSPAFGAQFSEGERSMVRTLLTGEPYTP